MIDQIGDDAESFRLEVDAVERANPQPQRLPTVAELARLFGGGEEFQRLAARVTVIERELAQAREVLSALSRALLDASASV